MKRFCFGIDFSERPETGKSLHAMGSPLLLHFKMGINSIYSYEILKFNFYSEHNKIVVNSYH